MENEIILVAGVSGSGRTTVMQVLIDEGFVILENVSSSSIKGIINTLIKNEKQLKIAIVLNMKSKESFQKRLKIIEELEKEINLDIKNLLLTAKTDILVNRYQEFRKTHPIVKKDPKITLLQAIEMEMENARFFDQFSDYKIDTSYLSAKETKALVRNWLSTDGVFSVNLRSFGFKYGIPLDSDFICDVRFLPNPHYLDELRPLTGNDKVVYDYVFSFDESEEYFQNLKRLLIATIDGYIKEGRMVANISIGCTGGRHRSVSFVNRLAKELDYKNIYINNIESQKGNW